MYSYSWCFMSYLMWLPRVSTKVTIRTGKSYKRNPSSVVLQSLFLRFASKVTNIITLIFSVFASWAQAVVMATKRLKNDGYLPLIHLYCLIFWFSLGEIFWNFPILWKWFWLTFCRGKNMGSFRRIHRYHVISYFWPLNWIALTEFFQKIICER